MANGTLLSRATATFQRYIFHFLPGLPVLVGIYIIYIKIKEIKETKDLLNPIRTYFTKLPPSEGLLGFTFFLIMLIFALSFVFLFGMIVDSIRHMIEEIFLVPKWSEYKIARKIKKATDVDVFNQIHETEYYYIEFYGNVAISLAFLWSVLIWFYEGNHVAYIIWALLVFLLRPLLAPAFWEWQKEWVEDEKKAKKPVFIIGLCLDKLVKSLTKIKKFKPILDWLCNRWSIVFFQRLAQGLKYAYRNVFCLRIWDFLATFGSIILLILAKKWGWLSFTESLPFEFYIIGVVLVTIPFDLYITRFRRFKELLKTLFPPTCKSDR